MDTRSRTYNVEVLTKGTAFTLYTCPDNCRAKMVLLFVTNVSGGTETVDVEWERADSSHAHILGGKNIANGDFIQVSDSYIILEPGDVFTVEVAGSGATHVDAFCTVEETFLPNKIQYL